MTLLLKNGASPNEVSSVSTRPVPDFRDLLSRAAPCDIPSPGKLGSSSCASGAWGSPGRGLLGLVPPSGRQKVILVALFPLPPFYVFLNIVKTLSEICGSEQSQMSRVVCEVWGPRGLQPCPWSQFRVNFLPWITRLSALLGYRRGPFQLSKHAGL